MLLKRVRVLLASGLLVAAVAGVAAFTPGRVSAYTLWLAFMDGGQVVPGPGDPDGDVIGKVSLEVGTAGDTDSSICVNWDALDVDLPATAVIGSGAAGDAGASLLEVPPPDESGLGGDCVHDLDTAMVQAIVDDPEAYFLQLSNDAFPDGAVRGQLAPAELVALDVSVVACPAGTHLTGATSWQAPGCRTVGRPGDIPSLPAGFTYSPKPLSVPGLDVRVDDGGGVRSLDDAEPAGGGTCNPSTHKCTHNVGFQWSDLFSGDIDVDVAAGPSGYQLAGAVYFTGGGFDSVRPADGSTVHLNTSGQDFVTAILVLVRTGAASTPAPNVTIPPTDLASPPSAETDAGYGPGLAILLVVGSAVVALGTRGRRAGREQASSGIRPG